MTALPPTVVKSESFIIGLSPQYWAHSPFFIHDIHSLVQRDGIDFLLLEGDDNDKFVPVSKCDLCGVIVAVEKKSGNSTLLLLDDGTGLLDCLVWEDDVNARSLPSLLPFDQNDEAENNNLHVVGNMVRILGHIKTVSMAESRRYNAQVESNNDDDNRCAPYIVREVHVTKIELINDLNSETHHWLKVLQNKRGDTVNRAPRDILNLLGPRVTKEAMELEEYPTAEDDAGAWRVFGIRCRCNLPYKDELLYCHCQAQAEPLDPAFTFRDALLSCLLKLQQENLDSPLKFEFRSLLETPDIKNVATNLINPNIKDQQNLTSNAMHLIRKTVKALRNDGILHLSDPNTDTYMLITREQVIEPFVKFTLEPPTSMDRTARLAQPTHLKNVPKHRLQYVRRCLIRKGNS